MFPILLFMFVFASGAAYMAAIYYKKETWMYALKPGTMLLIIGIALINFKAAGIYGILVVSGLLFSLSGDVFLMLPADRFLQGLSSFFIAHVLYTAAFISEWAEGESNPLIWSVLIVLALLFFRLLFKGVKEKGGIAMIAAVSLYITVITLMTGTSFFSGQVLIIAAALFFYLSDAVLAWDRFRSSLKYRDYLVMSTYFLAQLLFAVSVYLFK
ncbi:MULTISPECIES: lysoplasmalogenase [Metabacillus]|uniref:Lysoplasmalogenase n=1 Tax=Metabacillus hrfriensis TaxID=3048891 RepID=A0ACD4REP4_9BACI|nr:MULTISPECIES: lysoplasmalogenase [Metabacillus]UAL53407.1 lysoplasmalogenase [Metabacillus dongyingensis]USK29730.1 lysoplasmalogenase [Bacillus sp. CMF21]WHZ58978.1 lysoplasmalogenase [Metabacillus sp. CT-WN-B3]